MTRTKPLSAPGVCPWCLTPGGHGRPCRRCGHEVAYFRSLCCCEACAAAPAVDGYRTGAACDVLCYACGAYVGRESRCPACDSTMIPF